MKYMYYIAMLGMLDIVLFLLFYSGFFSIILFILVQTFHFCVLNFSFFFPLSHFFSSFLLPESRV